MYKALQHDIPVFVRSFHFPVVCQGKTFVKDQHFPWKEMGLDAKIVEQLFAIDRLYHNPELEKAAKVGDRLEELTPTNLQKLYTLVNSDMKTVLKVSKADFTRYKIKHSKVREKQIGLMRSWVSSNSKWEELMEIWHSRKNDLIESQEYKEKTKEVEETEE